MSQENTPTAEVAAPAKEGIQQGLADRSEAIKGIAQIRENLGQVAASREVHADEHGNLLLNREVKAVANGEVDAK